jgi:hypothetical protein
MLMTDSVILLEESGDVHVFLDPNGDDHIVIKAVFDKRGGYIDTMLPRGSFAFQRAVRRAEIGQVFLADNR